MIRIEYYFNLIENIMFSSFGLYLFSVPNRPPSIKIQPPFDVFYKAGESVEIPCIADGVPNPM